MLVLLSLVFAWPVVVGAHPIQRVVGCVVSNASIKGRDFLLPCGPPADGSSVVTTLLGNVTIGPPDIAVDVGFTAPNVYSIGPGQFAFTQDAAGSGRV